MENKMYNPTNNPPYNPDYNPPPYPKNPNYDSQPGYPAYPGPPPPPQVAYYPADPYATGSAVPYATGPAVPQYPPPSEVPVGYQPANTVGAYPPPPSDVPTYNDDSELNFGNSFSDKEIRRLYVRKVYLILLVQLLFTFGVVALFVFEGHVQNFVQKNMYIYGISYVTFLCTYFVLICCPTVRRKYPGNVICLAVFTVALTYVAATISSFHETSTVMIAAGICAGTCLGITLLSMWTKFDFTGCGPYLYVACWVLFFFGIACIFTYNDIMITIYSALGALLMMMFLAYDTQMVMGGRRHQLSPEEYIEGALQLYLDIVYMFLFLLRIVGGSSK